MSADRVRERGGEGRGGREREGKGMEWGGGGEMEEQYHFSGIL